ncbi:MAG: hypothetical protein NTW21_04035 [Verrucomicrobia bacterium]|nr:hypothetical protein [Verrucomicrobiota bacterium]
MLGKTSFVGVVLFLIQLVNLFGYEFIWNRPEVSLAKRRLGVILTKYHKASVNLALHFLWLGEAPSALGNFTWYFGGGMGNIIAWTIASGP